jgi:hypothetical protein
MIFNTTISLPYKARPLILTLGSLSIRGHFLYNCPTRVLMSLQPKHLDREFVVLNDFPLKKLGEKLFFG